jgi:hypothetical protein
MYSVILKKAPSSLELGLNTWPRVMFGLTGGFFLFVFGITPGQPILAFIFGIVSFISAGYWEAWVFIKGTPLQSAQVISATGIWPFIGKRTFTLDNLLRVEVQIPRGKVFASLATSAKRMGQEFLGTKLDRRVIQIYLVFNDDRDPIRVLTESTKDYHRIQELSQELSVYLETDFVVREV